jgi:hypothetical protein
VPITVLNGPNATPPFVNVGEMLNQGVDLQILTRGKIANSDYELTVNGGFLHNEIVALNEGATYLQIADADPDFRGIRPIRNQLGQSISSFFGYKVMGLFQSTEEVNAAATQDGAAPGDSAIKISTETVKLPLMIEPGWEALFLSSPVVLPSRSKI